MAACSAAILAESDTSPEHRWALAEAETIKNPGERSAALELIATAARRRRTGEVGPRTKKATARQIYENMAASLGIDVNGPSNPDAVVFRLGLRDLDPSRVYRQCKHLYRD